MSWKALAIPVVALLLVALVLHWSLFVWGPSPAGKRVHIQHDGLDRSYLFHAPVAGGDLVLVMHGANDFAKRIAEATGWSRLADEEGFMVAYPEGHHPFLPRISESWNAGHCCMQALREGRDDVGFIDAVVQDIAARHDVDRVFLAGFSNGGMLAYRIAAEHPERVDAVGAVAASLWSGPEGGEPAWRPQALPRVPIMHIHGSADTVVPMQGGVGDSVADWDWASMDDTLGAWAAAWNATSPESSSEGPVEVTRYPVDGQDVVVGVRHDRGHSWPGSRVPFFLSDPEPDYDATRALWAFFDAT